MNRQVDTVWFASHLLIANRNYDAPLRLAYPAAD